jgi:hypothetical protein
MQEIQMGFTVANIGLGRIVYTWNLTPFRYRVRSPLLVARREPRLDIGLEPTRAARRGGNGLPDGLSKHQSDVVKSTFSYLVTRPSNSIL